MFNLIRQKDSALHARRPNAAVVQSAVLSLALTAATLGVTLPAQFVNAAPSVIPSRPLAASANAPVVSKSAVAAPAKATWRKMTTPDSTSGYFRLWGSAPNDIFAVGTSNTNGGAIIHFDGTRWMTMTTPTGVSLSYMYGVWGSGPNDVYAVSWQNLGNGILHYDGTSWMTVTVPITSGYSFGYSGVWGSSANDVFIVNYGAYNNADTSDRILHFDGTTWVTMTTPLGSNPFSVWGTGPNDVFAVGYNYYGGGGGDYSGILHYDGSSWMTMTAPALGWLYGVWGTDSNNVYAVGEAGTVLRYNGTSWYTMTQLSESFLFSIWGRNANDLYVTSSSGKIYHYDGATWTSELLSPNNILWGVWGSENGSVYASGYSGSIWRHLDFTVDKQVTPLTVAPGSLVTYTLDVANITVNKTITEVTLQDIVPVSATVTGMSSSGLAITETSAGPNYVWQVQDLGPQMSGTITITAIVSAGLPAGTFTNTAVITGTEDGFVDFTDSAAALAICHNPVIVNNNNDAGPGSLRQAIADSCADGTVEFDLTYPSAITLSSPLTVSKNLTFAGPGADQLAVSGDQARRVFNIAATTSVLIDGLTIRDGQTADCGAGIYNQGVLTVTRSVLRNHRDTSVAGGGAICVKGSSAKLSLLASSVFSNSAKSGAGLSVMSNANATVANSSFFSNVAESSGGAIYLPSGSAYVVNSTIAHNTANYGGGIFKQGAPVLAPQNVAFGILNLQNSIVAGNVISTAGPDLFATAPISSGGHNLIGDDTASNLITTTGDITGVAPLLADPGLYGGSTFVLPLQAGSPAIDAANDAVCAVAPVGKVDQRGIARPQGSACDIGALESQGYRLTIAEGDAQVVAVSSPFTQPLRATLQSLDGLNPDGILMSFAAPEMGASASLSPTGPITVVDGSATVWALANDVAGSYVVTASVQQVAPAYVHLTQQVPVDGLSAESSSPTYLSHFTGFTASVTAGTDVSYTWDFGDGSSGAGQTVEHRYNDSGHFTATVTAHNAISEQSTQVWVNVATQGDLSGKLQTQLAQDNIRYSFVVSNAIVLSRFRTQQSDPYLLSNVVLTGSVPANTTLVDWSANVITSTTGGSYGNGYVQLSVPTQLAPGENVTITWLVHPQSMSGDIQTDAKATSDTGVAQPTVLAETYLWRSLLPLVFR